MLDLFYDYDEGGYPTKAFNEMQAQFPTESTVEIMTRLGYEYLGDKLWYNKEIDRYGLTWEGFDTSRYHHSASRLFHGVGYKKGNK